MFLYPPSCVHRDRRPDLNRKRRPFTPFCFPFFKCFVLFQSVCFLSVPRHGSHRSLYPAIAHCKTAWEFAACAASLLAASPHARRSREISAAGGGSPKPAGGLPSSRVRRSREITPPDRRWLNARRPASDSMPAGSPLTQAHRIAADSCPLAAAYPSPVESPHVTARSAVFKSCCAHSNILIKPCLVMSCPRRLVWGRRPLLLWPWRPF